MKWKTIDGPTADYEINELGEVRSNKRGRGYKLVKSRLAKIGYWMITLCYFGKPVKHYVHRLLAKSFIPNHTGAKHINHKNGVKSDNRLENLEWVTHEENMQHAHKLGLCHKGETSPSAKVSDEQIKTIIMLRRNTKLSLSEIAKMFNISQTHAWRICAGYRTEFKTRTVFEKKHVS